MAIALVSAIMMPVERGPVHKKMETRSKLGKLPPDADDFIANRMTLWLEGH